MTRIETVLPRASQKLTGGYTLKESDMGRKDLTNTITASAGALMKSQTLDAPTVEAVNYDFEPSMTLSNAPDESNTYNIGDTVEFETHVQNSGNQTLRNVEVSEMTEGVSMVEGEGYELVDGKAVFDEIAPKESASAKSEYVSKEGDDAKEDWVNTAQIKMPGTGGGIAEIIKTAQSPVVIFAVPGLEGMSWQKIKQAATDARSNPEQYYGLLGDMKTLRYAVFNAMGEQNSVENAQVLLVEVNPQLNGVSCGFVFFASTSTLCLNNYESASNYMTYADGYAPTRAFNSKSSDFFRGIIDNDKDGQAFVDALCQVTYNSGYTRNPWWREGGITTTENCPINVTGIKQTVGYGCYPTFFELFGPNGENKLLVDMSDSYTSNTYNKFISSSIYKQCSMGYMKNILPIIKDTQGLHYRFADFRCRDVFFGAHDPGTRYTSESWEVLFLGVKKVSSGGSYLFRLPEYNPNTLGYVDNPYWGESGNCALFFM